MMKKSNKLNSIKLMLLVINVNAQTRYQVIVVMVLCHQVILYMVRKPISRQEAYFSDVLEDLQKLFFAQSTSFDALNIMDINFVFPCSREV